MGRALTPCLDAGEEEIVAQGPSHGTGGENPPMATLSALLLALLWRGSLAQVPGYSLTVPPSVSVQEGLCVLVPCTFTYPARYDTENPQDKLYGHWFKGSADVDLGWAMASSDPSRRVSQETRGRFRLVGDPARGNCSLQISNVQRMDEGSYFLRVERGTFKYSYRVPSNFTEPRISLLSKRPWGKAEIQMSPALGLPETLVAGEPVTVTCMIPGLCSRTSPQITWTVPFSDTARDVSVSPANGTRAHSSELRFTPARGDDGKNLTCTVTYSPAPGPSTSRAVSLQVCYPPGPPNITWTLTRNKHPVLGPAMGGAEGDGLSLEIQEGDSLTLICEAGSKPVATLSWTKANESLSPGTGGVGHLELSNLSRGDAGEYRCWVKNPYGSASRALRVHVQEMILQITVSRDNRSDPQLFPELSTLMANDSWLTAREGDSLRFLCSVASRSPASLAWVWGDRAINNTISVGENRLQLELHNVTAEDGGLYGCQAQSQERSTQGTFQLLIEYSPRLGTRLNSSCQRQGPRVSCSCSLRSHPLPRLHWQVDGEAWAGNDSWGALQVSSWADGDEAVSTLNWTGSGDSGPRIFCLGSNPYGTYAALHFDLSPPGAVAEEPARLLGLGVACGLGVAVGCCLLGCCVVKLRSRRPAPPSTAAIETANGTQGEHPADDAGLIYSNISSLPMNDTTLAARWTKGIQDGAAATQGPSGPRELAELHYASIDFSKEQHKGGQPPEELATEYSEIRMK